MQKGASLRKTVTVLAVLILLILCFAGSVTDIARSEGDDPEKALPYSIVGTGQAKCYGERDELPCPKPGQAYFGQDAQNASNKPSYKDNGDGTVTDLVTGLMWVKARGAKLTWNDAIKGASKCKVGGQADWRMPTIKEIYSLILFTGKAARIASESTPYIDTKFFEFAYGNTSKGERLIDCQDWSGTRYVSTTMDGNPTAFGVNFADGRIKGYPITMRTREGMAEHKLYVRYVRGNPEYGKNSFEDNGDKTIADKSAGLVWAKSDSGKGMNWKEALAWVEQKNSEKYLGHDDWRLPNAKELQSIVDYQRSPDATNSPAIDPIFSCTAIKNEGRKNDYPFYWSSTTHLDNMGAVYVCFGRALGFMAMPPNSGNLKLLDVHGAGAQRSDPKSGNPSDFPHGKGPQGDVIRIYNYARLVRNLGPIETPLKIYP